VIDVEFGVCVWSFGLFLFLKPQTEMGAIDALAMLMQGFESPSYLYYPARLGNKSVVVHDSAQNESQSTFLLA
jgi:hypothetical protein